jgi:uncharacterized membrane protein YeaQ/YmgE (transglycosylase-associated protein family)
MKMRRQIEAELAHLQRIPLFNRVFREAHGKKGIFLSVVLGLIAYAVAVSYASPWQTGYTESERYHLIIFVCIAGFLAAPCIMSYIVEFGLSTIDLIKWKLNMKLELNTGMKALLVLISAFTVTGILLYSQPRLDIWGIYCFFMLPALIYLFVTLAWRWNYSRLQAESEAIQSELSTPLRAPRSTT